MMHHRQQTSSFLRSSRGIDSHRTSDTSSSDCSSTLSIISRRCSSHRGRTSTLVRTSLAPSTRCTRTRNFVSSSTSSTSSSSCPVLLSVLAWSVTLLLISSCLGITDARELMGHPLGKRSFLQLQCKGVYDKSLFARLDRICEDCYNLFREPSLHTLCRKDCFTTAYFKGCLDVLLLDEELEQIQSMIKHLHGADPGV